MGDLPDWYTLLRAARYCGATPWELAEQPIIWTRWALAAESAEVLAERNRAERRRGKS